MPGFDDQRDRLASAMERRGAWPSRTPWIREAVDAVPRDEFAPGRLWHWDGHAYVPVDRAADACRWANEIVRAAAAAHGAALTATPRPAGGLHVDVRFPARPTPGGGPAQVS